MPCRDGECIRGSIRGKDIISVNWLPEIEKHEERMIECFESKEIPPPYAGEIISYDYCTICKCKNLILKG